LFCHCSDVVLTSIQLRSRASIYVASRPSQSDKLPFDCEENSISEKKDEEKEELEEEEE
jgi:hypothetical protein